MRLRPWSGSWGGCDGSGEIARSLTFRQLVEAYLAQRDVDLVTIDKLRWLLGKGSRRLRRPTSRRVALRLPVDAAQALRQVLARAVLWGMDRRQPGKTRRR